MHHHKQYSCCADRAEAFLAGRHAAVPSRERLLRLCRARVLEETVCFGVLPLRPCSLGDAVARDVIMRVPEAKNMFPAQGQEQEQEQEDGGEN